MSHLRIHCLPHWSRNFFPIDDLPEELLAEVLVRWADIDKDAPWMATLVSCRWYSTVLSCPRAWSRVHVCLTQAQKVKLEEDLEWCVEEEEVNDPHRQRRPLRLWFSRARDSDLYMSVEIGLIPSKTDYLCKVLGLVEQHMSKLTELEMNVDSSLLADEILSMLWKEAPALLHVTITCSSGDSHTVLSGLLNALDTAPSVHSLKLIRCMLPPPKTIRHSPHQLLRTLHLEDFHISHTDELLDCFEGCQALENLTINHVWLDDYRALSLASVSLLPIPHVPSRTVTLPSLAVLIIRDHRSQNLEHLLCHLVTPKLRTLLLYNLMPYHELLTSLDGDLGMDSVLDKMSLLGGVLAAFFQRGTELRSLFLECSHVADEYLLQILELLPNLSELHLKDSFIGPPAITGLTVVDQLATPLCPSLQTIALQSCDIISGKLLIDLVASRQTSNCSLPITTLDILQCKMVLPSHIRQLQGLV